MALETSTFHMDQSPRVNSFTHCHQRRFQGALLQLNKLLVSLARATAENGTDGDGNALLSETSTSSTIASPSTQPSPPIHGEEHESTNIANTDDSEDVIDLSQPAPIRNECSINSVKIPTDNNLVLLIGSDTRQRMASSFEDMDTERKLTQWQISWGYCLVKGVPVTPEATKKLLERIAFIRETHYGGFWDFTSDLTFKDSAYTDEALDAHTDNTYFSDPARLQLFHLLEHTGGEGGTTLLVDGFYAAYRMLVERPRSVEALTDYAHPWHSSGNEDVSIQPYRYFPVFEREPTNARLLRIRWNNYDRAAKIDWTPTMAMQWYGAARYWNAIIRRENQTQKWLQLEPGTALLFDNWRMLHGRSAFTGKRRMCGGYKS
uniref:Trimethyllysine dioxygenase n=1 Tax=Talaromyces marneffei PM1 TaxID=1077442 RepID=A0A093VRQ0_TALMA